MRQLIFACALALTACVSPSADADPLPADPQLARACVADAGKDRVAISECVGLVTRACVEAEGGSNAMSDVLCRSAETEIWEAMIEEATARITAADPVDGELLAAANQTWTAWREAECNYRAYEFGGGSGEQYDRVQCYMNLTAVRAVNLLGD